MCVCVIIKEGFLCVCVIFKEGFPCVCCVIFKEGFPCVCVCCVIFKEGFPCVCVIIKEGFLSVCAVQLHGKLSKVLVELQEEKVMNKSLRDNQQLWQKRVTSLETSVKELAESKERVGFNKSSSAVLFLSMCVSSLFLTLI